MAAWGYGIFSDDVAADVRDTYRDLISDGIEDGDAVRMTLEQSAERDARPALVWLALAASQTQLGRLSSEVKERALRIIDDGTELAEWPPESQRRRQSALLRLRQKLEGPQPARRTVRRQWRPSTDLYPGDVLAVEAPDETSRLLRTVVVVRHDRGESSPMLELLDYQRHGVPSLDEVAALPAAFRQTPTGSRAGARRWVVSQAHKSEPTWIDSGFVLVGRGPVRDGDLSAPTNEMWSTWGALRAQLSTLTWFPAGAVHAPRDGDS